MATTIALRYATVAVVCLGLVMWHTTTSERRARVSDASLLCSGPCAWIELLPVLKCLSPLLDELLL